ncbi:DUF4335 domain-containing protein, partial [Trichothermofontia sp.]
MFAATTLLRRYTPPTCTLELYAQQSPLSRWASRPVVRDLRFRLHLDDPRLPDEQRTTLQGDRQQLEALHTVVETYVQAQLAETEWELGTLANTVLKVLSLDPASEAAQPVADTPAAAIAPPSPTPASSAKGQDLRVAAPAKASYPEPPLPMGARSSAGTPPEHRNSLQLEPDGGLYHRLYLGPLATAAIGDTVQLSTLQLFDLVTALDTYSEELMALPETLGRAWFKPSITWARTAAIVIVVIGVATSVVRLVEQPQVAMQTAVPTGSEGASSYDQRRESVAVTPLPT